MMNNHSKNILQKATISRRRFIKTTATAAIAPFILPSYVRAAVTPPASRINLGFVGMGIQMRGHLQSLLANSETQVVAVCDVDTTRREDAQRKVNTFYSEANKTGYKGCAAYNDFRELVARQDIDAVVIATPDHWHALVALAAVNAGKDVYCEKPLTHTIGEAVALVAATRKCGRIFQTGSQQRSSSEFRVACELVRNSVIGSIQRVEVHIGGPARPDAFPAEPMEPGLDWDFWCGPGPLVPYNSKLSPRGADYKGYPAWRVTREFGGGGVCDWGAHHIDIAQWGLNEDGHGPVEVIAPEGWQDAKQGAQLVFAGGISLKHDNNGSGVSFYGRDGEVHVGRGQFNFILNGKIIHKFWDKNKDVETSCEREVTLTEREYLADAKVRLYKSKNHRADWLAAIKSRKPPICDVATGASTAISCHLVNCAYYYGARAKWNPEHHDFAKGGDQKWLTANYRGDWKI